MEGNAGVICHREEPQATWRSSTKAGFLRLARNDVVIIALLLAMLTPLTSCGHKGKLKTPSQIAKEEENKAAKAARNERRQQQESPQAPQAQDGQPAAQPENPALPLQPDPAAGGGIH